jgi:DNA-binding MarR family transcriptional regulator
MNEERTVVDFRRNKFIRVTREVINDTSQLKHASDIAVYTVLCMYADNDTTESNPKIETIAKKARCSERTVKRALTRLKDAGYIEIVHRFNSKGHRASSQYYLIDPKVS